MDVSVIDTRTTPGDIVGYPYWVKSVNEAPRFTFGCLGIETQQLPHFCREDGNVQQAPRQSARRAGLAAKSAAHIAQSRQFVSENKRQCHPAETQ